MSPNQTCERTACADRDPHAGRIHLDPTSDLYDGPDIMLRALPHAVRDQAFALLHTARKQGWDQRIVDRALDALGNEIHRLRDQVAAVRVDKDRSVRHASAQALDCEHHGKVISQLEDQVGHFSQAEQRADKGRLALLAGITAFDDFVDACDLKAKSGETLPDVNAVVEAMRGVLKKTHAAHKRAWSR